MRLSIRSGRAAGRSLRMIGVIVALLALAGPVTAKTSVDPTTLNPPPPDFFNATCEQTGSHILCNLAFSDPDIVDEPSGIVCGTTELLFSQQRSVVGKRFYDAAGNLTQRHFRESFDGTFTNPDTDQVATWTQHDTIKHDLSVPGDVTSGTTHISGLFARITGPNGGTILTDTGMFLVVEGTGETLHASAHHPIDDYFANGDTAALAPLCDALD